MRMSSGKVFLSLSVSYCIGPVKYQTVGVANFVTFLLWLIYLNDVKECKLYRLEFKCFRQVERQLSAHLVSLGNVAIQMSPTEHKVKELMMWSLYGEGIWTRWALCNVKGCLETMILWVGFSFIYLRPVKHRVLGVEDFTNTFNLFISSTFRLYH